MSNENTNPVEQVDGDKGRLFSLGAGALLAAIALSIYSLFKLVGFVATSAFPYVAGVTLFAALMSVFISIVFMLKRIRRSAQKSVAITDCYRALAVIGVLGYFAAACVATFQPGADPSSLWTYGVGSAALFGMLFAGGKFAKQLFNESGDKSKSGR